MAKVFWLAMLAGATLASAQTGVSPERQVLEKRLASLEKQLLGVAEAMPPEQYSFAPTGPGAFRGVRNFAKQLKHAAAFHYVVGAAILGEAPPADAADERGPDALKTKAEVMQYVKDSITYLRKAINSINSANAVEPLKNPYGAGMETRLGLAMAAFMHSSNHYGQIVEYLRMNGITPPSSE